MSVEHKYAALIALHKKEFAEALEKISLLGATHPKQAIAIITKAQAEDIPTEHQAEFSAALKQFSEN